MQFVRNTAANECLVSRVVHGTTVVPTCIPHPQRPGL